MTGSFILKQIFDHLCLIYKSFFMKTIKNKNVILFFYQCVMQANQYIHTHDAPPPHDTCKYSCLWELYQETCL